MRQLAINQSADTYKIIDDFLTLDHIGHITMRIETFGMVKVDIAFTSLTVREPFVLSLELTSNGKDISEEDKARQLYNMYADINKHIFHSVKSHSPIIN